MPKTVKARVHHGAESLDLTIPAKIVREYDVSSGDIFEIDVEENEGELTLEYTRVYQNE